MRDYDFGFKAAVAALVILGGLLFYRMRHPATVFATDGIDANWDAAAQRSRDASRPTIVLFSADWCPACRSLHQLVLSRGDVQEELRGHYGFYHVDLTNPSAAAQSHAQKLGVSSIPLMIRYDADGKETDRTHYRDPAQMIEWLKAGE